MAGNESPGWRPFTDGGFKRQIYGTEVAGWGVAVVSPDSFVRVLCGPVLCDPQLPAILGATTCSNNTAELTGLAEALREREGERGGNFFMPRGERVRILFDSKHAARVTLGVADAKKIALARSCNELLLRLRCKFHISVHHVFGHAGNAGNQCDDIAATSGMKGFVSESNVPLFWARKRFFSAVP